MRPYLWHLGPVMVFETPFGLFVSIMFLTWVVMGKVRISCWFDCCGCSCCCCRRRCGCCCCSFLLWEMDGNLNISEFLLLIVKLTLVCEKIIACKSETKICKKLDNTSYILYKERGQSCYLWIWGCSYNIWMHWRHLNAHEIWLEKLCHTRPAKSFIKLIGVMAKKVLHCFKKKNDKICRRKICFSAWEKFCYI